MAEIMTTMAGKAAGDVQAAERELCMKMNALAMALLQQAEPQPVAPPAEQAAGAGTGKGSIIITPPVPGHVYQHAAAAASWCFGTHQGMKGFMPGPQRPLSPCHW